MRVRAIKKGYYGGKLRDPENPKTRDFDVPDGEKATWFAPLNQSDRGPAPKAKGEPNRRANKGAGAGLPDPKKDNTDGNGGDDQGGDDLA